MNNVKRCTDESEQDYEEDVFGYNPLTPPPVKLQGAGENKSKNKFNLTIPSDIKKLQKFKEDKENLCSWWKSKRCFLVRNQKILI